LALAHKDVWVLKRAPKWMDVFVTFTQLAQWMAGLPLADMDILDLAESDRAKIRNVCVCVFMYVCTCVFHVCFRVLRLPRSVSVGILLP
jgi:hypothetical protein